jgi:phage host-nuclease inhibitor protein Gam
MDQTWVIPVVFGMMFGLPMLAIVGSRYLQYREKKLELMADKTAEKAAQYAAQVEKLESRMRVLERIATDKGAQTAAEIEELRKTELN